MKKLMYLVMAVAMSLFAADASAQSYIPTITSTACIVNGAGDIVTSGTLVIVGTDANDNPIPYRVNSSNQATTAPISRTITNGQLATGLQLANPTLTSPVGVLYRIVIQDNVTKKLTLYKQVIAAANSGSNYDLCIANLTPSTAAVITVTNPGTVNGNTIQNGDFTINGRDIDTKQTITFSATPTFDCSSVAGGSYFKLTLTGNVTSSTLSNCNDGQSITLELCQDATGSRTFVAPTNIQSFTTIPSTASTCTSQFFKYDGGISKAVPDSVAVPFSNSAGLAALLSDETGTGLAVFNISPSLTTPVIGSAGASFAGSTSGSTIIKAGAAASGTATLPVGSGTIIEDGLTQTMSAKTLTAPVINTPSFSAMCNNNNTGCKSQRFGATCTTAATANTSCTTAYTWTAAFANTSYTAVCQGEGNTGGIASLFISSHTASQITIVVVTPTATAVSFSQVNCIANAD